MQSTVDSSSQTEKVSVRVCKRVSERERETKLIRHHQKQIGEQNKIIRHRVIVTTHATKLSLQINQMQNDGFTRFFRETSRSVALENFRHRWWFFIPSSSYWKQIRSALTSVKYSFWWKLKKFLVQQLTNQNEYLFLTFPNAVRKIVEYFRFTISLQKYPSKMVI